MLEERGHSCPQCGAKNVQMSVSGMYDIRGSVERDIAHLKELLQYGAFKSSASAVLYRLFDDLRDIVKPTGIGIDIMWIRNIMSSLRSFWEASIEPQVEDLFPNLAIHLS